MRYSQAPVEPGERRLKETAITRENLDCALRSVCADLRCRSGSSAGSRVRDPCQLLSVEVFNFPFCLKHIIQLLASLVCR